MLSHADLVEAAVRRIARDGEYPSPARIERMLGMTVAHNLNGRDCATRELVLRELGWQYVGPMPKHGRSWLPPAEHCGAST